MEPQNVLTRLTLELAAPEALEDCDIAHNFSLRSAVVNFFKIFVLSRNNFLLTNYDQVNF